VMMSGAFFKVWRGWDDLVAFHAEFCGEWRRHRRVVLSREEEEEEEESCVCS